MSDKKVEQPAGAGRIKSNKRWHFRGGIILMTLAALAVVLYLFRSALASEYEGVGAALCAVACGGFLIWHVIHLFAEQDQVEEREMDTNQPEASPPDENSTPKAQS